MCSYSCIFTPFYFHFTESKSETQGRVSCTATKGSPQPLPTPGTSAGNAPSSQAVSQPVPQSGLSAVLTKYKKYLKSYYNARVLAKADKYLPTLHTPYINLAMISMIVVKEMSLH